MGAPLVKTAIWYLVLRRMIYTIQDVSGFIA